jgi:hypothetical protein
MSPELGRGGRANGPGNWVISPKSQHWYPAHRSQTAMKREPLVTHQQSWFHWRWNHGPEPSGAPVADCRKSDPVSVAFPAYSMLSSYRPQEASTLANLRAASTPEAAKSRFGGAIRELVAGRSGPLLSTGR